VTRRHTFDEQMRCIRCRIEYARKAEPCEGDTSDAKSLGALAKRNEYRERLAERERQQERARLEALAGLVR